MKTNLNNHGTSFHGQLAQHSDQDGLACRAFCGCSMPGCDKLIFTMKSGLCHRHYDQQWYQRHAEKLREASRNWVLNNPEKARETKRKTEAKYPERKRERLRAWRKANPERQRFLRQRWENQNPGRHAASSEKWKSENRERIAVTRNRYLAEKKRTDPHFRILCTLRNRVGRAVKTHAGVKAFRTVELLGCSVEEFLVHLVKQWKPGMSWENYGRGRDKWNIDHIIPCDSFDLTNTIHQRTCFHYSNQRPLWQPENCAKGNLIGDAQIPLI